MTDDDGEGRTPSRERKERPPPRKVTPAYLDRAALAYLERFASSADNLRRVLRRKVETRCRLRSEDPAAFAEAIDETVAKAVRIGLLDDRRFAEARAATLRRRGGSARAIAAKLAAKGVDRALVAATLAGGDGDEGGEDAERAAAFAFARRRRLGPFRPGERGAAREKDLAALARAGFSFALARAVIDADEDDLPP